MDMLKIYKAVLDADRAAVVLCTLDHTIVYMNKTARERYAKWGGEKLVGRSVLDCHNERSREMIVKVLDWFAKSKDNNIVYTFKNVKENKDVYMVALLDDDEELIGYYEKHEYRDHETMNLYELGE